ncbi:unnamed protein product, partial [Brenthis ino]
MIIRVLCVLCVLGTAVTIELTDEQYYSMPRLFELDDYEECIGLRGAFCMGSFLLRSSQRNQLLHMIQEFSETRYKFNHTIIHRGYCVTRTCADISSGTPSEVFENCVQNRTETNYGLEAKLLQLEYCTTEPSPPMTIDTYDIVFVCVTAVILLANILGTAYDLLRNKDNKPNRYLMTWSLRVNWGRLVAIHDKEDSHLTALNPVHGLKAILLMLVVMVHSIIAYHMTYMHNPRFLEESIEKPHMMLLNNGTTVVQTFIMLSSFLLAYNVLLSLDKDPNKKINFRFWWKMVLHRVIRILPLNAYVVGLTATWWRAIGAGPLILPLNAYVVGLTATWWRAIGAGPLWRVLVAPESARCRRKWWTHVLFLNNLLADYDRCQIQSWFLATDMQLYLVASVLLVALARHTRLALRLLSGLFVLSVVMNFFISYFFNLNTILYISEPEAIRQQFFGEPSFQWLYASPWFSLPASILGLFLAFAYHLMKTNCYNLHENKVFRAAYAVSIPAAFAWILGGCAARDWAAPAPRALYSALERPVFDLIVFVALLGFFYDIKNVFRSLVSWSAWRVLSRMSLAVLLVHWAYNLMLLGLRTAPVSIGIYTIGEHWLGVLFMTYLTALPLHLLVEAPMQKFLEAVFN